MEKILDFYSGFEGAAEVSFICGKNKYCVNIWEGFFYDIMMNMLSCLNEVEGDLKGIAYYYNVQAGWYDESPWQVENLDIALSQFHRVRYEDLEYQNSKVVLRSIIELLEAASINKQKVYIKYS